MEMQLPVKGEREYTVVIQSVCSHETWQAEPGWDMDYGKKVLELQVPVRNGDDSVSDLILGAVRSDAGLDDGKEWEFQCDMEAFIAMFIPKIAQQMTGLFVGAAQMQGYFDREPYVYLKIVEGEAV